MPYPMEPDIPRGLPMATTGVPAACRKLDEPKVAILMSSFLSSEMSSMDTDSTVRFV